MAAPSDVDLTTLGGGVRQALKQWHGDSMSTSPLAHLYLFRQLQRQGFNTTRQSTNQVVLKALTTLRTTQEEAANLLQMRFLDLLPVDEVANKLNVAQSTIYTLQRTALQQLTLTLAELEQTASQRQQAVLHQRLPTASYVNLIGVEPHLAALQKVLTTPGAPWVLLIEGIGGIGKTSLADALLRLLIATSVFDEVAWVSAQPLRFTLDGDVTPVAGAAITAEILIEKLTKQLLPEAAFQVGQAPERLLLLLQTRLKAYPHLVVVDNLETLSDVESLLPTLHKLANPTKFVLTSRTSLYSEPNLFHFRVPELTTADALHLVRQEAALSNLPVFATCSDAELLPIIETVGGNPLAIRLIVGQTHVHPLEVILGDLRHARSQTADNFYTFIYRWAWNSLSELEQRALLVMPLANPHGDDLDYLAEVGDLEVGELRMAMNRLVMLNLVDGRGGLQARRYSIHSLTRTFLQEEVAKWY